MIKRLFATLLVICFGAVIVLAPPVFAQSDSKGEICEGVNAAAGESGCGDTSGDLDNIIEVFIDLFSIVIGIIAVIMIMVGGFKYVTSGGDSGKIQSAKHTLIYAIVGLIIVALAQFIAQFVLSEAG